LSRTFSARGTFSQTYGNPRRFSISEVVFAARLCYNDPHTNYTLEGGNMKNWFPEQYKFKITALSVGNDGNPHHCRNGHEVGDTYECGYGLPGGFCSITAYRLFTLQEVVRSGGDLRNLMSGAEKSSCVLPCADGVVNFKIEALLDYEIKPLTVADLPIYADVIRKSFATVASDFGWTRETAPTFTAYISDEKLSAKVTDGYYAFGLFVGDVMVGFVSLTNMSGGVYELNQLAVLPGWRHFGYGKELLGFCKNKARELGGNKIALDIIEENTVLKYWYAVNGFKHTGTKKFDWQPFTAGFMEWETAK
jgi:uncharacterized repeat protein (TIGR04076 family)